MGGLRGAAPPICNYCCLSVLKRKPPVLSAPRCVLRVSVELKSRPAEASDMVFFFKNLRALLSLVSLITFCFHFLFFAKSPHRAISCGFFFFFDTFFLLILFSSQKAPMKRFRVGSSSSSFEVGVGVDQNLQTQLRVGVEPRPQPRVRGWRPPHSLMVWFHLSSAIRGWGGG